VNRPRATKTFEEQTIGSIAIRPVVAITCRPKRQAAFSFNCRCCKKRPWVPITLLQNCHFTNYRLAQQTVQVVSSVRTPATYYYRRELPGKMFTDCRFQSADSGHTYPPERRAILSPSCNAGLELRRNTTESLNSRVLVVPYVKHGIQASDPQQVNYLWTWVHQLKFTALPLHRG